MAINTIQIPINKSSNNSRSQVGDWNNVRDVYFERVSDLLYLGNVSPIGLAWDKSLMPVDKNIISIVLHLYANSSIGGDKVLQYADFGEGSSIPYPSNSDMGVSLNSGWSAISLPSTIPVCSIIIGYRPIGQYPNFEYTTFNSSRASSNRPYIEVTYSDIPPDNPSSLYPDNIIINPRDVIKFAWKHNSREGNQQKGFTLQYKIDNGSWVTVSQTTSNQFYDMPANTLPTTGSVTWQVKTTDDNGETSGYTSSSFTLGIVPQKAPIAIAPISQYIDESNDVKFEWNFNGGSPGETQSKFDLQYSTNGGNTWITKTVTSSETFYTLESGVLSTGNITWRVRTYNNWNEVSPYSENRSFSIIGSPPIPLITEITNAGKPIIKWQAQEQHLYELQILKNNIAIFDSGTIPSTTDAEFKLPIYLKDGNYKVKLRIFNEFNLNSPYAEKTFTISTVKPQQPIIAIYSGEYTTTINIDTITDTNLVYRDDILIGEAKDNQFIDYTGKNNKEYKYFIRSVDSSDNFSDSEIKLGKCSFKNNTLATLGNPGEFIKLKYGLNKIPGKTNSVKNIGTLNYFDGREYPVAEYTEFKSLEKSLVFFVKTKDEKDKLIELIDKKKTLLYRDYDGENIKGSVFSINFDRTRTGYNVNFTITKTEV